MEEPIDESDIDATINAKKLYASCLNEEQIEERGIQPLLNYINGEFNGWPILENNSSFENITVLEKLIRLKTVESSQLFELFVSTNPKDPKHNLLRIIQPSWFFNREYLSNEKILSAYKHFLTTVVNEFMPGTNLTRDIDAIYNIEMKFANVCI